MNDIRQLVTTTLKEIGFGDAKSLGECLLCHKRTYVGVRFTFEGVSAIWLGDADHVRFVDESGTLLKVVRLNRSPDVARKAA